MSGYENVVCSDNTLPNAIQYLETNPTGFERGFSIMNDGNNIRIHIRISLTNSENVDDSNWSQYEDLAFTITL